MTHAPKAKRLTHYKALAKAADRALTALYAAKPIFTKAEGDSVTTALLELERALDGLI
jgi:hypothetical protein